MKRPSRPAARLQSLLVLCLVLGCAPAGAATIGFSGPLRIVSEDAGNAVYSGVPIGTIFYGEIDDQTFDGFISDGTTVTPFTCCIAAGMREVSNDAVLDADSTSLFNDLWGTHLAVGDKVDLVDIEGDASTPGNGRIEIGISFGLRPDTFADENPPSTPLDPADILGVAFFIAEFDDQQATLYDAIGTVAVVPLPPALWLLGAGVLGLVGFRRRAGAG